MMFDDIGGTIRDFMHEKPLISTIIGIVTLLFLAALVIILIQTAKPGASGQTFRRESFSADAKLLIPAAPEVEKDYYPSRTVKNAWTEADVAPFFTVPDTESMQSLEKANDAIIAEIIGAAP